MNNTPNRIGPVLALTFIIATTMLSACHRHGDGEAGHAGAKAAGEELKAIAVTHFSEHTELFVEYEPLIVGQESKFAAHMSTLSDFKPVTGGKLFAILDGGNQPEEKFMVDAPARAGIFRPLAKPKYAGQRKLTFQLVTPQFTAVHAIGAVTIHPNKAAAAKAQAAEKPDAAGAISYLKEQQWVTDYGLTPAAKRVVRESVAATGTLRAPAGQDAQLSAIAAGQVVAAGDFPRVGMAVKQGQVLAYLVPRLGGETDLATLELTAQKARLGAQQASRERERMEVLFKQEAVPEKRLSAARNDEKIALAELAGAERRAGQYHGSGNNGIAIRAPITGTVAEVSVAAGGFLNEGQPILHIANAERLWLEVRVAESDIGRIGQPTGAAFRADGFERQFELSVQNGARLVGVGNVVDPVTRTVPLLFDFPNPNKTLRIGMAVRATVYSSKANEVAAIPAAAVIDDNGQAVVYVQRGGEAFERRAVQLGTRDGDWIEVKSGVTAGERVVSTGAYQVRLAATAPAAMGEGHVH